jgi:catechol 2,3-dioxygenase
MVLGRLAHVEIGAGDPEVVARFYRELLGVVEVARHGDTVFLSGGATAGYDLALGPWPVGLRHFAFQVGSAADLDEAVDRLGAAGHEVEEIDVAAEHGIERGISFVLPSGHVMRLVLLADPFVFQPTPTLPDRHRVGVGPAPLEHITLNVDDVERTARFLVDNLEFRLTEVAHPRGKAWFNAFLRVRDLHHDLGLFHNHEGGTGPGLDHYGFAVPSVEELVRAADIARSLDVFLECSIGRHLAGDNVFLYLSDPTGNRIEIATALAAIDVSAPTRVFEARSDADWRGIFDAWREGIPPAIRTPNPCFDGRVGTLAGGQAGPE